MSKKVLIIIVVNSVIILGLMGAGFYIILNKVSSLDGEENLVPKVAPEAGHKTTMMGPLYSLDAFIVNLADNDGKRYLRVAVDLELSDAALIDEMNKRLPQVRDSILMILPSKKLEDLQSVQGKTALREEIIATVNSFLIKGHVSNLYFTEFVFQ